jgi:hypothetical protein
VYFNPRNPRCSFVYAFSPSLHLPGFEADPTGASRAVTTGILHQVLLVRDLRGQKDAFVATELPHNNFVCRCSIAFEGLIQIFAPRSEVDQ